MQYLHSNHPCGPFLNQRERQFEVLSLPIEILAQIFTYLDFPSVRSVGLSCKSFYSVTKTRQFWYQHIHKLIETHHVSSPEDELDNYTVDELEKWTLRRARALDIFCNSGSGQPRFRKRTLDLRPEEFSCLKPCHFKLIPGGRWLLVSSLSAVPHFLDLDCRNPTPCLLFDPKKFDDELREPIWPHFSIWMDRGAPRLSFRLAFRVEAKDILRTYTSQIDLAGHGVDATLVASNIAMLRNFNLDTTSIGTALNDRYLVQIWSDASRKTHIGVYDYRQALGFPDNSMNSDGGYFSDMVVPRMMEFIHGDTLAIQCVRSSSLFIFEVGPSTSHQLLHHIRMRSYPYSAPRWTPKATVITMLDRHNGEFQALIIPHNSSHPPTTVVLGEFNHRSFCNYTLGMWVLVAHDNPHNVFSLNWDLNAPTNLPRTIIHRFQADFSRNLLTFDENTGRFLSYLRNLTIYDIT